MDSESFSKELKEATFGWHTKVQKSTFAQDLTRGNLDIETYSNYAAGLLVVYRALEKALKKTSTSSDAIASVYFPKELNRVESLEKDLEAIYGEDFENLVSAVTKQEFVSGWVKRIQELEDTKHPVELIAHAYTRYMGDLSGGQMLKKKIATSLGVADPEGPGVLFYNFKEIEDPKAFKDVYRAGMDKAMGESSADKQAVIEEVRKAYALNLGLLDWVLSPEAATLSTQVANLKSPAITNNEAKTSNEVAGCCVVS